MLNHLEDADFAFPGIPDTIDIAISWGVFTHLPADNLIRALTSLRAHFGRLEKFLFTLFLANVADADRPLAQPDGVVTHADRPPYHVMATDVLQQCAVAGFAATLRDDRLPRGQRLWVSRPL